MVYQCAEPAIEFPERRIEERQTRNGNDVLDAIFTLWERFRSRVPVPNARSRNVERCIVPVPR